MKRQTLTTLFAGIFLITALGACSKKTIAHKIGKATGIPLTKEQVAEALKGALLQGVEKALAELGLSGAFKNGKFQLALPEQLQKPAKTLRDLGLGKEVDKFLGGMQTSASGVSKESEPIFDKAIKEMTFADAFTILRGDKDAATNYFRQKTEASLLAKIKPLVKSQLNKTESLSSFTKMKSEYEKIPLTKKINVDLEGFIAKKIVNAFFTKIKAEEKNIRDNPGARTTQNMKRVFAEQD